jgi:hypothetical protein
VKVAPVRAGGRRPPGEGRREKISWRRPTREGLLEKAGRRRSADEVPIGEGSPMKARPEKVPTKARPKMVRRRRPGQRRSQQRPTVEGLARAGLDEGPVEEGSRTKARP